MTGVGDVAGGILRNISLEGMLAVTPKLIRGDRLALRSDKLNANVSLLIDLATGRFDIMRRGRAQALPHPRPRHRRCRDAACTSCPGRAARDRASSAARRRWVRRLDNAFFASLTGGLPRLTTDLERGPDGILRLTNLQLYSPKLRLSGVGMRRRDGSWLIEASGRQAQYGALRLRLDGRIERPRGRADAGRAQRSAGRARHEAVPGADRGGL